MIEEITTESDLNAKGPRGSCWCCGEPDIERVNRHDTLDCIDVLKARCDSLLAELQKANAANEAMRTFYHDNIEYHAMDLELWSTCPHCWSRPPTHRGDCDWANAFKEGEK